MKETKTIAASEDAYKKVFAKRRKMEEESGKVVSMTEALDALLGQGKKRRIK